MLPLYIDPGTGSMLFSLFIGLAAAAAFGLKALWVKIRFLISGGKAKADESDTSIPYVIFSDHKRYWNVFKPICDEFETRGVDLVYYTASEDDPVLTAGYKYIHPEFIGTGNKPYAKLNFLNADIVLSTTPGLDVYQWKRSKKVKWYVHVPHSVANLSILRMFGIDYYDAILISGSHQEKFVRFIEKERPSIRRKELVLTGLSYYDYMLEKKKNYPEHVPGDKPLVLLAPSWGNSSILNKYGTNFIDKLLQTGYQIVIRPHPQSQSAEKELLETLKETYKDNPQITWNFDNDNFDILNKSDILISDFSGVMYDYAFIFNKPFIYTDTKLDTMPYDASWEDCENWNLVTLPRLGIKLEEKDFDNMKEMIDNTISSTSLSAERQKAKEEFWNYPGEAGKRITDYMLNKRTELIEKQ